MAFNPFLFVLALMAIIFSVPIVAIWTEHRRKMAELQARLRSERADSTNEVKDLARQIADLRSTATEYDLSFDSALQRLESRMDLLDERLKRLEGVAAPSETVQANQVRLGER